MIKLTPGPADYDTVPAYNNSVIIPTHNYALNNGGVKKIKPNQAPKEVLLAKTFNLVDPDAGPTEIIENGSVFSKNKNII